MEIEDSDTSSSASDDVPSTTASVTSPVVTSPSVISTRSTTAAVISPAVTNPPVISTCSTAAVSTSCPTVAVTAPLKFLLVPLL